MATVSTTTAQKCAGAAEFRPALSVPQLSAGVEAMPTEPLQHCWHREIRVLVLSSATSSVKRCQPNSSIRTKQAITIHNIKVQTAGYYCGHARAHEKHESPLGARPSARSTNTYRSKSGRAAILSSSIMV